MAIIHGKTVEMETVKIVEDRKENIKKELQGLSGNLKLKPSEFKFEVGNQGVDSQFIENVNKLGGPVQPNATPNRTRGSNRGRQWLEASVDLSQW